MAKRSPTIDPKKMMATYLKFGTPGEPHGLLASLEGSWTTRTRGWVAPDQPPMESSGTCEQKMILGGRYLEQVHTGDMGGGPFNGISILGYDNYEKKFVSTWIDNMSTAVYRFEGTSGRDKRTITQETRYDDPVRGPAVWRTVTRIRDDNTIEFEMYLRPRGRKEEKMMEMTMTRKVAAALKAA